MSDEFKPLFRELRADEIECRVGTCSEKGVSLLLYKDNRSDMRILDETFGTSGWQSDFKEYKGTLFGGIGIKFGDEWIWKWNAGSPSNMEAAKGEASDAIKRAAFMWGIGRSLYTAPHIWIPSTKCAVKKNNRGNWTTYDRFHVEKIAIEDGRITGVRICNHVGAVVFSWKE